MQITVADVQKINVQDGETLVVFVDIKGYPRTTAEKIMQDAARFMRGSIANQNVGIVVVPQDRYSFGVIAAQPINAPLNNGPIPVNQTIGNITNSGNVGVAGSGAPSQSDDAWDRAMKGLG
jgi:hypothetical protein